MSGLLPARQEGEVRYGTFNILKGTALDRAEEVAAQEDLDIFCLQEAGIHNVPQTLGDLTLASSVRMSPQLGLSMYYQPDRLTLTGEPRAFMLPLAWYERFQTHRGPRLQVAGFTLDETDEPVLAGNFHLPNLWTPNQARRVDFSTSLGLMHLCGLMMSQKMEIKPPRKIVGGDTNYAWFEQTLRELAHEASFDEVGTGYPGKTHITKIPVAKFDRVFIGAEDFSELNYAILEPGESDHHPVVVSLGSPKQRNI